MLTAFVLVALAQAPDDVLSRCPAPVMPLARVARNVVQVPGGGVVTAVDRGVLRATLCAFENHEVLEVRLEARLAATALDVGARVERGQVLGKGSVTLDGLPVERFFERHPYLFDPHAEAVLVVVDVDGHEARRYERGVRTHTWEVGRGQAEGVKVQRGDLKTPRGLYFVTDKSTGPFGGDFAGYYGGHWVKVNYPNAFDARRGLASGWLSEAQATEAARTWWRRALTTQKTKLGGGIGFHGWIAPWRSDVEGFGLSWGCVVLHPEDVGGFYASVPVGAAVLLR
ncbi:MAG: L,D-transpeptidase [Myxococcaceae bacterium]|nr:L,D-transpeptidase [Myxococcaceae bacterium]